jgi:hypothetical protein
MQENPKMQNVVHGPVLERCILVENINKRELIKKTGSNIIRVGIVHSPIRIFYLRPK